MSTSPGYDLQVAIAAALLGASAITNMVGQKVFDDAAAGNSQYHRICIGDDQVLGRATPYSSPSETYVTVHIWANTKRARHVAKQLGDAIRGLLTPQYPGVQPLSLASHSITSVLLHDERYPVQPDPTNPDGFVCHGILTFYYRTLPLPA